MIFYEGTFITGRLVVAWPVAFFSAFYDDIWGSGGVGATI